MLSPIADRQLWNTATSASDSPSTSFLRKGLLQRASALYDLRRRVRAHEPRFPAVAGDLPAREKPLVHEPVHVDGHNAGFEAAALADVLCRAAFGIVGEEHQNIDRHRRQAGIPADRLQCGMVCFNKPVRVAEHLRSGEILLWHKTSKNRNSNIRIFAIIICRTPKVNRRSVNNL